VTHATGAARGQRHAPRTAVLVDPIDGTNEFILGIPGCGRHAFLGSRRRNRRKRDYRSPLGRTYWAEKGHGAFRQDAGKKPKAFTFLPFQALARAKSACSPAWTILVLRKNSEKAAKRKKPAANP